MRHFYGWDKCLLCFFLTLIRLELIHDHEFGVRTPNLQTISANRRRWLHLSWQFPFCTCLCRCRIRRLGKTSHISQVDLEFVFFQIYSKPSAMLFSIQTPQFYFSFTPTFSFKQKWFNLFHPFAHHLSSKSNAVGVVFSTNSCYER